MDRFESLLDRFRPKRLEAISQWLRQWEKNPGSFNDLEANFQTGNQRIDHFLTDQAIEWLIPIIHELADHKYSLVAAFVALKRERRRLKRQREERLSDWSPPFAALTFRPC